MQHPNLIRYYGVAIESTGPASFEVFIVTEYMDGGGAQTRRKAAMVSVAVAAHAGVEAARRRACEGLTLTCVSAV